MGVGIHPDAVSHESVEAFYNHFSMKPFWTALLPSKSTLRDDILALHLRDIRDIVCTAIEAYTLQ
jgi:hypothetical protein